MVGRLCSLCCTCACACMHRCYTDYTAAQPHYCTTDAPPSLPPFLRTATTFTPPSLSCAHSSPSAHHPPVSPPPPLGGADCTYAPHFCRRLMRAAGCRTSNPGWSKAWTCKVSSSSSTATAPAGTLSPHSRCCKSPCFITHIGGLRRRLSAVYPLLALLPDMSWCQ